MRSLILILTLAPLCHGQFILTPTLMSPSAVAAGYTGPGDLGISGIKAWWGLRCYSTSFTGTIAQVFDAASGSTTETILTCSVGGVINETVNALSVTCASGCVLQALFDQSGQNSCGGSACTLFNNLNADRATFTQNCIGSLPCATRAGGALITPLALASTNFPVVSPPYTVSTVCERTGATSTQAGCIWPASGGGFVGPASSANTWLQYGGASANVTAADNVVHAVQAIFNGASSTFYLDGSSNATSIGALNTAGNLLLMSDGSNALNGKFWEAGVWSGAFSGGQLSSMNSNQHAYWGF